MAWTDRYVTPSGAGSHDGTSEADAWTLAEGITNEAAGMRVNMKAGTYANTTTSRTWAATGTTTAPIWWRGYKTTPGDLDSRPTASRTVSTDMPHLTWSTGAANVTGAYHKFSNISFLVTGNNNSAVLRTHTNDQHEIHRCRFEHQDANSSNNRGLRLSAISIATECYVKATSAAIAVYTETGRASIHDSVIDGGAYGIYNDSSAIVTGNLFINTAGDAIFVSASNTDFFVAHNTIYNPTGHGISIPNGFSVRGVAYGNLFHTVTGSGKAGIKNNTATAIGNVYRRGNAYYNVTTPEDGFGDTVDFDRVTEGSDPLTNPGSGDYTLKTTASSFQAGPPGLFEGLTIRSYASIGAQIPDETGGGGGGGFCPVGVHGPVIKAA